MSNLKFLLGRPDNCLIDLLVYPPKIKDILDIPELRQWYKVLTLSQEDIEDAFAETNNDSKEIPTPFEMLLINCYNDDEYLEITKKAFKFFVHLIPVMLYEQKKILLLTEEDVLNLSKIDMTTKNFLIEENFLEFQNKIREAMGESPKEAPDPNEDPRVKKIKAKGRYRERIKAKSGKGLNLSTLITSISCMGFGLNPLNIEEMTYVGLISLFKTYQNKELYERDIKSIIAGCDPKKIKPEYWIKNID